MVVKRRLGVLLAGTVLGTSFLIAAPAFADDAQLQQQIDSMQQQLNAMQAQLAQTKAQAAPQSSRRAPPSNKPARLSNRRALRSRTVPNIPPNLDNADLPIPDEGAARWFDTVHVRWPARSS